MVLWSQSSPYPIPVVLDLFPRPRGGRGFSISLSIVLSLVDGVRDVVQRHRGEVAELLEEIQPADIHLGVELLIDSKATGLTKVGPKALDGVAAAVDQVSIGLTRGSVG